MYEVSPIINVTHRSFAVFHPIVYVTHRSFAAPAPAIRDFFWLYHTYSLLVIPENTIILFACPPKFCISIVFVFFWDHCKSQVKLETMLMQNLGGQANSIMVFSGGAYYAGVSIIPPRVLASGPKPCGGNN